MYNPYTHGSLSIAAAQRSLPQVRTANPGIQATRIQSVPIPCPILSVEGNLSSARFMMSLSYHLSWFYTHQGETKPTPKELLSAAVGLLASCVDYNHLAPWNSMLNALGDAGIDLVITKLNYEKFVELAKKNNRYQDFCASHPNIDFVIKSTSGMFVLSCVLLLSVAKNIDVAHYTKWFNNRVAGIARSIGDESNLGEIDDSYIFAPDYIKSFVNLCSSNHRVRKSFFETMLSVSRNNSQSFVVLGFIEVIQLMKCTEITHLVLIDKYILTKYSELTHLQCMKGFTKNFNTALTYLNTLDEDERCYVRLLRDKNETGVLSRHCFDVAITVASAAARFESKTYRNYRNANSTNHQMIDRLVTDYLDTRTRLIAVAAGERDEMGAREKELFFQQEIKRFEQSYTTGMMPNIGCPDAPVGQMPFQ